MVLIAHRGNTMGPNPADENNPVYIQKALNLGFHVEIDVWMREGSVFLGHDEPQYLTTLEFIKHDTKIICHAKTVATFQFLLANGLHCFYHNIDRATLTSNGKIWLYPGIETCKLGILVMPEWKNINYGTNTWLEFILQNINKCYGVCSDYVQIIYDSSNIY